MLADGLSNISSYVLSGILGTQGGWGETYIWGRPGEVGGEEIHLGEEEEEEERHTTEEEGGRRG